MFDTLLTPATKKQLKKLKDDVSASHQIMKELTAELESLESKATVRVSNSRSNYGSLGDASQVSFYTMLPDSFQVENKTLIANTQAVLGVFADNKAALSRAKWDALKEVSDAATEQYLMAANVLKQQHSILYALANRDGPFRANINLLSKLNIPCSYVSLTKENLGQAGEPVLVNQQLAIRHGTAVGNEITAFLKPEY